jgi:mono/diheme cytochrome c family protein
VTQACEELAADRITFVRGDQPIVHNREQFAYGVYVELRPDVIAARMQQQDPDARSADLNDDLGEDLEMPAPAAVVTEAEVEALAEVVAAADEMVEDVVSDAAADAAPEAAAEEDPA